MDDDLTDDGLSNESASRLQLNSALSAVPHELSQPLMASQAGGHTICNRFTRAWSTPERSARRRLSESVPGGMYPSGIDAFGPTPSQTRLRRRSDK
jgi:hypothetical protein